MCGVNGWCVLYVYTNTRRPEQLLGIINWGGGQPGAPANAENVWRRAGQHMKRRWFPSIPCIIAPLPRALRQQLTLTWTTGVCLGLPCVSYPWTSPCCRWDWRSSSRVEEPRIYCKTKTETLWAFQLKYYTITHSCLTGKRKCGASASHPSNKLSTR